MNSQYQGQVAPRMGTTPIPIYSSDSDLESDLSQLERDWQSCDFHENDIINIRLEF